MNNIGVLNLDNLNNVSPFDYLLNITYTTIINRNLVRAILNNPNGNNNNAQRNNQANYVNIMNQLIIGYMNLIENAENAGELNNYQLDHLARIRGIINN